MVMCALTCRDEKARRTKNAALTAEVMDVCMADLAEWVFVKDNKYNLTLECVHSAAELFAFMVSLAAHAIALLHAGSDVNGIVVDRISRQELGAMVERFRNIGIKCALAVVPKSALECEGLRSALGADVLVTKGDGSSLDDYCLRLLSREHMCDVRFAFL